MREDISDLLGVALANVLGRGRTQIAAGSRTVLGIIGTLPRLISQGSTDPGTAGPARLVNQVTGKLRLL